MPLFLRFRNKIVYAAVLALLVSQTTACSLFAPSRQMITIQTNPPGAEVVINGQLIGTSPIQAEVRRNQNNSVMAMKDGYFPSTQTTSTGLSTTGVLDLIGGILILVPLVGLFAPGAYNQVPRNMTLLLAEDRRPPRD